ncbi:hypothetical protein Fmac_006476 [Flemingia macrophylla]|uniref:DUF4378 domain-containing protein n=1 Tax=Flemingia macrophylla TaxID=520843 RepID=A0ABD1NAR3_9FABA
MAQKHLHELLKEDQEPFLLNKYISERRSEMKSRPYPKTSLQVKKRKSNFPGNLCLFSLTDTPDMRKSPLFEPKSPCKFIVPSRTAALLLEAAMRIHKHSSRPKTKAQSFGLLGSLYKRLTHRRKKEIDYKDFSLSNANEDKSLHSSTTAIHFLTNHKHFCESPFRFVLQSNSPSDGHHTPELLSPTRHTTQDKESNEGERVNKFESGEEEEEDKEQCSPVCVLDPLFEDDDEGHGNEEEEENDLECSYAIVQRAKQQLFYKLRRFEKLAGLDPVELEKRMQDEEDYEDETFMEDDADQESGEESYKENDFRELISQALRQSRVHDRPQIPEYFKKLVCDLIMEEERELNSLEDRDLVIRRICKRLELWKEVESNTIDMMIEDDFSREDGGWKKNIEQIRNIAGELELAIFGFLVDEFSEELVC